MRYPEVVSSSLTGRIYFFPILIFTFLWRTNWITFVPSFWKVQLQTVHQTISIQCTCCLGPPIPAVQQPTYVFATDNDAGALSFDPVCLQPINSSLACQSFDCNTRRYAQAHTWIMCISCTTCRSLKTSDFSDLVRRLWHGQLRCVSPTRFHLHVLRCVVCVVI